MKDTEIKQMADFEKHYWWHKGKLHLVQSIYDKFLSHKKDLEILEIGCGTGEVMSLLSKWGRVTGIDISETAIGYCRQRGFKNLIKADISNINIDSFSKKYDLIVALDVLEHIRDDLDVLKKLRNMLKSDGILLLSSPAYKLLWSTHDEALHHVRRYHSLELKTKFNDAGFRIYKLSHFVSILFFPIAFLRIMENFVRRTAYPRTSYVEVPEYLNNLFTFFLKLESNLIKYIYLPVGTTLFVVAGKNDKK